MKKTLFVAFALAAGALTAVRPAAARVTAANNDLDTWCVGPSGNEVCATATGGLIPTTDKQDSLGGSALRWKGVFADTITVSTTLQIPNLSIGTGKLAALSVDSEKLAAVSVNVEKIVNLTINSTKLGALSVDSEKLAALSVNVEKLVALSVNSAKLGALSVDSEKLVGGAVNTEKLLAIAVDTSKLNFATTGLVQSGKIICIMGGNTRKFGTQTVTGGVVMGECQ